MALFGSRILTLVAIVLLLSLFGQSSHFQFGNVEWSYNRQSNALSYTITQAWRFRFWFSINDLKGKTPAQIQTTVNGYAARNVGNICFGRSTVTGANSGIDCRSLLLKPTQAFLDPMYANDSEGYFFGQKSFTFTPTMNDPNAAWGPIYANNNQYVTYFTICCRISSLQDGNNDKTSYHWAWFARGVTQDQIFYSISAAGFPREFIHHNVQMYPTYKLAAINRHDTAATVYFVTSPAGCGAGGSCLANASPGAYNTPALTITNNVAMWAPKKDPSTCTKTTGYCPHAYNVGMEDRRFPAWRLVTQLDFLFIVIKQCGTPGAPSRCPPVFNGVSNHDVIATVPFVYTFTVSDPQSLAITLENTPLPTGLLMEQVQSPASVITVTLKFDVDVDGPQGAVICFKASNTAGLTSVGSYCPILTVLKPEFMFITGTLRTFTNTQATSNGLKWSSGGAGYTPVQNLPADRKIVLNNAAQQPVFSDWFSQGSAKLYTFTMIRYYNGAADPSMSLPTPLPPSNGTPDPRRRVFSFRRPYWEPQGSENADLYFTYEFHTVFDLLSTENGGNALKFAATGGELYVYMNQRLVLSRTTNQGTITDTEAELIGSSVTATLTADSIRSTLGLDPGVNTLDLDVFYTHRNTRNSGFHIEFGSSTACSAVNILSSPQYADLLDAARLAAYVPGGNNDMTQWRQAGWVLSNPSSTITSANGLQLLTSGMRSTMAAAWYGNGGQLLKVLSGFEAKFTFKMTSGATGLVFVIQANSPTAKGSEGQGLGYSGLNRAIAIEFDTFQDSGIESSYPTPHISAHKSSSSEPYTISSVENAASWPVGSTPIPSLPNLPFNFNNNTDHDIRITFSPTATVYWMTIYVNKNIRPLYVAQFPRNDLETWFADGAYVGFTAANPSSVSGDVSVSKFALTIVPPLAEQSGIISTTNQVVGQTYQNTAGTLQSVTIQLRDACGSDLSVKGEASRFVGYFIHETHRVESAPVGSPVDLVVATVADRNGGQYEFSGRLLRAGSYRFYFYYREVNQVGDAKQPIGFPPHSSVTFAPTLAAVRDQFSPNFKRVNILAAPTSAAKSFYVFPNAPLQLTQTNVNNAPFPAPTTASAVACIAADQAGNVIASTAVNMLDSTTAYTNFLGTIPNDNYGVCVVRGVATAILSSLSSTLGFGTTNSRSSATWVIKKTGATVSYPAKSHELLQPATLHYQSADGIRFDTESWSPSRVNVAGTGQGRGMILVSPPDLIVPAATTSSYYLFARDEFGNNNEGSTYPIIYSFTNSITPTQSLPIAGQPFVELEFETTKSGTFGVNTFLDDGAGSQIGNEGSVVVSAGAAHYSKSTASGVSIGGTVGTQMSFKVYLFDLASNQVVDQGTNKQEITAIQWVDTTNPSRIVKTVRPVYTEFNTASADRYYDIKYTPKFAGTYFVKIYINSVCGGTWNDQTKCNVNPAYEMTSTVGAIVAITAGPVSKHSLVSQVLSGQSTATPIPSPAPYVAGQLVTYTVQTKDSYGNNRLVPIPSGQIRLYFSDITTGAQLKEKIDITASSGVTLVSGEPSVEYLIGTGVGNGQYRFLVVYRQAVTSGRQLSFRLDASTVLTRLVTAPTTYDFLANDGDGEAVATWNARNLDATVASTVSPGTIDSPSTVALWCPTADIDSRTASNYNTGAVCPNTGNGGIFRAVDNSGITNLRGNVFYLFKPRDIYGNAIAVSDGQKAAAQAALSIQFETSTYNYKLGVTHTILAVSGDGYIGSLDATTSGIYTLSATTNSKSATIQSGTVWKFEVLPNVSDLDSSNGRASAIGKSAQWPGSLERAKPGSLFFEDLDRYDNPRVQRPGPPAVAATSFKMYRNDLANPSQCIELTASQLTCATVVTNGPGYNCEITFPSDFQLGPYTLHLSNGCTVGGNGCPAASCSISQQVRVVNDGATTAWVAAVTLVNSPTIIASRQPGSGQETTAISLNGTPKYRAGQDIAIYVFEGSLTSLTTYVADENPTLRLLQEGQTSQFPQVSVDSIACSTTHPDAGVRAVCSSNAAYANKALWRFVVNYSRVTSGDANRFAVWSATKSTENRSFTFSVVPAVVSAATSMVDRPETTRTHAAGASWTFDYYPFDRFGNPIDADFPEFTSLQYTLYSLSNTKITQLGEYNPTTGQRATIPQAAITCQFATGSTVTDRPLHIPAGSGRARCTVPGGFFTYAKLEAYYFAFSTTTLPDTYDPSTATTTNPSIYAAAATQTNQVTPAAIKLTNSFITPQPLLDSQWAQHPAIGDVNFKLYLFGRDRYNNPCSFTLPNGEAYKIKFTAGDWATTIATLDLASTTSIAVPFALSSSSSATTIISVAEIKIKAVTRTGFSFTLTTVSGLAAIGSTPPATIKLRSGVPDVKPSNALYTIGTSTTPIATPITGLTIDSTFSFDLILTDANGLKFLYDLSPDLPTKKTDDTSSIIATLTRGGSTLQAIVEPVFNGPNVEFGKFRITIAQASLAGVGTYTLVLQTATTSTPAPIITYTFDVAAGEPRIDNTQLRFLEEFFTGAVGRLEFTLYDRLHNPILVNMMGASTGTTGHNPYFPITTGNQVYPSLHVGSVECQDIHDNSINSNNLQWKRPFVTPSEYPDFTMDVAWNSPKYTVTINPAPAGTYTFNLTYVSQNVLTIPRSTYTCNPLIPNAFTVRTGPPNALKSYYTVLPRNKLTWGTATPFVGYAGEEYDIKLHLIDRDGSPTTKSSPVKIFQVPTAISGESTLEPGLTTIDINTGLYWENVDITNLLALEFIDQTEIYGLGQYSGSFKPKVAQNDFIFAVYLLEEQSTGNPIWKRIVGTNPNLSGQQSAQLFSVLHGVPAKIVPDMSNVDFIIAGTEMTFNAYALDAYGNRITTNALSTLSVVVSRDRSTTEEPIVDITGLRWTLPSSAITSTPNGDFTIKFTPAWEGKYSFQLIMSSPTTGAPLASSNVPSPDDPDAKLLLVLHATCAGRILAEDSPVSSSQTIMCASNSQCVDNVSQCPLASDRVTCEVGFVYDAISNACKSLVPTTESDPSTGLGYKKCSDGSYILTTQTCPVLQPCPSGTSRCANSSQCRSNIATDCPSTVACPTGTSICPNQLTCALSLSDCPTIPQTVIDQCTALNKVTCPSNGICVGSIADCPTPRSCQIGQILCLSDNSCQTSADKCPTPLISELPTPTRCAALYPPNGILCPTGECASSLTNCPSQITCAVGQVLCASDNSCRSSLSQCSTTTTSPTEEVPILPDPTTFTCSQTEIRCSNGACVQHPLLCATEPTCPTTAPILCADKTCKPSLAQCTIAPTCPTGTTPCPVDGTCVQSPTACPVISTCPITTPVKCPSGSCAATIESCPPALQCPPSLPYACSTGVCRSSRLDCPSSISCSPTKPLTCPDGSCAISLDMCSSTIIGTDPGSTDPSSPTYINENGCYNGYQRCPTGECTSANLLTCPTHISCPIGFIRCNDGTCRKECSTETIQQSLCTELFLVQCPTSGNGSTCAKSLSECPTSQTCPITKPVKCAYDVTCAVSVDECPLPPPEDVKYPVDKVPCADGSWVVGTPSDCPTPVTCPTTAPIKCYDQTCAATIDQCPQPQRCPTDDQPYRCPNGQCSTAPWDCISVDPIICPSTSPVKCQTKSGTECKQSVTQCPTDIGTGGTIDTEEIPLPDVVYSNPCQTGFTYCRDGSCQESPAFCPAYTCPVAFPTICFDGSCAVSTAHCPSQSGCPWDAPIRCVGRGNCVSRLSLCERPQCGDGVACADGTCRNTVNECKASNGCNTGQTRCADGTCVDDQSLCIAASNSGSINSCPPGTPFKCGNGLCVQSSASCTTLDPIGICTDPKKPVLCAIGGCYESTSLCPLIKPCETGLSRCDDGYCRNIDSDPASCPVMSSCPIGQIRCKQDDYTIPILDGMCAKPGECLSVNGCQIDPNTNKALNRCSNGRCVRDLALCTANLPFTNGCTSDFPIKCWNGKCAATQNQCDATNNCPFNSPLRCPNGQCTADLATCPSEETCSKVKCADGSCVENELQCSTSFGCPVNKPIRCFDGSCKKFPATYRNPKYKLTNAQINELVCSPVVACPSQFVTCGDSSCVLSDKLCPATQYLCDATQFRCLDGTCRPSSNLCGYDEVINPDTQLPEWKPSDKLIYCPTSSPLLCPTGACVADFASCDLSTTPGSTTLTGSPTSSTRDSTQIFQTLCADGTYRNSYQECRTFAQKVNEQAISADDTTPKCVDYCADGTCLLEGQSARACPVVSSCNVGTRRCFDGSCRTSCEGIERPQCDENLVVNVDGQCRTKQDSIQFNGCGLEPSENYLCLTRECASGPEDCINKQTVDIDEFSTTLLEDAPYLLRLRAEQEARKARKSIIRAQSLRTIPNSLIRQFQAQQEEEEGEGEETNDNTSSTDSLVDSETQPESSRSCVNNCVASYSLSSTSVQYSPLVDQKSYIVGPAQTAFTITLYSGLQVNNTADSNIYIEPVPTSVYFNATNKVTYSRVEEFGSGLTAAQTVLSPVFSCSVGDGIVEPFDISLQLSSLIDRTMSPITAPQDMCLARLRRYPEHNYAVWECLFTDEQRTSGDLRYTIRQTTTQSYREAISFITQCYDNDLSTIIPTGGSEQDPASESFDMLQDDTTDPTVTSSTKVPAVYAFIRQPLATSQVYLPPKDTFWRDNIIWLLFVIIGGVLLVFLLIYAILRLSRYTKKTKDISEQIKTADAEIQDMEQFGNKNRDQEVGYVANPLAVSLEQQQAIADQTDEQKLAARQAKLQAQQLDSAERQEVAATLQTDNEAALAHLQQLQKKAGAKSGHRV